MGIASACGVASESSPVDVETWQLLLWSHSQRQLRLESRDGRGTHIDGVIIASAS